MGFRKKLLLVEKPTERPKKLNTPGRRLRAKQQSKCSCKITVGSQLTAIFYESPSMQRSTFISLAKIHFVPFVVQGVIYFCRHMKQLRFADFDVPYGPERAQIR
jgi:hypothetical protein